MSAGICGKRLGLEEIFGSPSSSSAAPSSNKRLRFSSSPSWSSVYESEEKVAALLRMFPSMDREVIETVLNAHDHKIDDAIKSLHALRLGDISLRNDAVNLSSTVIRDNHNIEGKLIMDKAESKNDISSCESLGQESKASVSEDGSSWVDIFVQEMMNATNWDDVRGRATKILEAFESKVIANCKASSEQEIASLQEQLQCLLRENQILKRAVAIQHDRGVEYEEKLKEAHQLKQMISQYQEQVRTLELNNYTLKIHLQRAQDTSSIPSHFHPDVF